MRSLTMKKNEGSKKLFFTEKRLLGLLAAFYTGLTLLGFIKTIYIKVYNDGLARVTWSDIVFSMILEWSGVMLFSILISRLVKYLMQRKISLSLVIPIHLIAGLLFGIFMTFLHHLATIIDNTHNVVLFDLGRLQFNFIRYLEYNLLIYFTVTFIIYTYYYINRALTESEKKNNIEQKFNEAKAMALQNQLHPHFLFNSLNNVSALIDIDKKKSKDMIADISEYLYNTVNLFEHKYITLEYELELLDKYLNIIETRFQAQLSISKSIQVDTKNVSVPPLIIQPIVENAVKHGYSRDHEHLNIKIDVSRPKNQLCIQVSNDGLPLTQKIGDLKKNGTGIKNIDERLSAIYGNDYQLNFCNDAENNQVVFQLLLHQTDEQTMQTNHAQPVFLSD
ncbi:histidine kinase [Muricauda sp. 2012CJ35-5]|uniref:Histidine kinase n=1 Tax=Flagellimonas spongiicola TaxID=2942208 RepID=A0ABT0PN05_9FLAO|nr:histidine kinase [Allomuricauda spongiicola]MCL6272616.1 histidine kinase [Allomuricauda spongiicola]